MTDNLQHIKQGDLIRASMLNKVIDGAKIALDSQKSGAASGLAGYSTSNTLIRTRVHTALPRYAVVSIDDVLFSPSTHKRAFLQAPAIRAGQPDANTQNFAILQRPAAANHIVPACVAGISIVELYVLSDAHEFAVPNESYTMSSAESGAARIVWKDTPDHDGKTWALISFPATVGGAASSPDATITLITPLTNGFVSNKVTANSHIGEKTSPAGYNGQGAALGKLSTHTTGQPLKVFTVDADQDVLVQKMSNDAPLYYKEISVKKENNYVQFSGDRYQVPVIEAAGEEIETGNWFSVPCLYAFLCSLSEGEAANGLDSTHFDYSGLWETTTHVNEAVTDDYVVVKPHNHPGYKPYQTKCKVSSIEPLILDIEDDDTVREAASVVYSVTPEVAAQVKMKGQVDWKVYQAVIEDDTVEWKVMDTRKKALDNLSGVKTIVIDYDGTHPAVENNDMIENMCTLPYTAGLWIDSNGIPQWINCEGIPYNMCIPILYVDGLYRISEHECSPGYMVHSYPVKLEQYLSVSAVNYIPSYKSKSPNPVVDDSD